jgi:CheY-like chemotaxis protein
MAGREAESLQPEAEERVRAAEGRLAAVLRLEEKVLQREKLAAVGQLVSGIAHELNNPLTAVTGYAQLLESAELPAELQEKAARIRQEAERAIRIVSNLLLFARGGKAEKQAVQVEEILERSLSLRAYELKVENIEVARELPAGLPPVLADPHQLEQVFLNILLNAEQAILSARNRGRITLSADVADGRLRLQFSNDGPGIAPELLPHIFEPFVTTKPAEEGTGLGLFISRTIVREHGGEIHAESGPTGGATFVVELPVEARPGPRARPSGPGRAARGRGGRGRRVLVVDDEPAVAYLIADALEQEGCEVRVHTDSQRALGEALAERFDLAVLDVRMPGLDGPAFYRILRREGSPLAGRLLFTTGDTLARETAAFLEQARLPYLPKPFHVEELQDRVRAALEPVEPGAAERNADDD